MGSPGIAARMRLLGHTVSRSTVRRILLDRGIDPAPVRDHAQQWVDFLAAHAHEIAAIDFTTVECFADGRPTGTIRILANSTSGTAVGRPG